MRENCNLCRDIDSLQASFSHISKYSNAASYILVERIPNASLLNQLEPRVLQQLFHSWSVSRIHLHDLENEVSVLNAELVKRGSIERTSVVLRDRIEKSLDYFIRIFIVADKFLILGWDRSEPFEHVD